MVGDVGAFLGELRLEGAQKPLGAMALLLAQSLEDAPAYARARLARELHDLLTGLEAQAVRDERAGGAAEQAGS